ncbi:MAG: homoserine kinase [Xanthomonadales bacterium]|nr:homoserine kinase [Xanthomonadales bacterium]
MTGIRAQAAASIGNFSVGFDLLGVALQVLEGESLADVVEVSASTGGRHQLEIHGKFADYLPDADEENLVWQCLQAFEAVCTVPPLKLVLFKNLPISSGLGSSASSIVAAAAALNAYLDEPLTATQLLVLCGRLEGGVSGSIHLDNIAPSLLGGLVLCNGEETCALPFNPNWRLVVAYSGQEVSTRLMRDLLPAAYPATEVIQQMTALAAFISALHRNDWSVAEASLLDYLAEPRRAPQIEGYTAAKTKCLSLGANAVGISGSGPTLFALCYQQAADQIADWLTENYAFNDQAFTRVCEINRKPVVVERF